jgi:uncharacterized protein YggU (UPF0235/DUF167 family)
VTSGRDPAAMARLKVKVVPGSTRDQIVGWLGDALKQAIPEADPDQAAATVTACSSTIASA